MHHIHTVVIDNPAELDTPTVVVAADGTTKLRFGPGTEVWFENTDPSAVAHTLTRLAGDVHKAVRDRNRSAA